MYKRTTLFNNLLPSEIINSIITNFFYTKEFSLPFHNILANTIISSKLRTHSNKRLKRNISLSQDLLSNQSKGLKHLQLFFK